MNLAGFDATNLVRSLIEVLSDKKLGDYRLLKTFQRGHAILTSSKGNIYVLFKREPFYTFEYQFKEFIKKNPLLKGEGESVNLEVLNRCENFGCREIAIIHPNEVYFTFPNLIRNFCTTNHLIRGQVKLNYYVKQDSFKQQEQRQEVTYSFPQKILSTFKDRFMETL